MIYAQNHQMIKTLDPDLFSKIYKQLFSKKEGSLVYASPHILESLLVSTNMLDENGEFLEASDQKQKQNINRKV